MMKSFFYLVTLFFSVSSFSHSTLENEEIDCGFSSLNDLLSTAREVVNSFSSISGSGFDPLFYVNYDLNHKRQLLVRAQERSLNLRERSLSTQIQRDIRALAGEYRNMEQMSLFHSNMYLEVDFSYQFSAFDVCNAPGCLDLPSYSLILPLRFIERYLSIFEYQDVLNIYRSIIGHEIGHYILDIYLFYFNNMQLLPEQSPLEYHLLIDAISIVLSGESATDFTRTLIESSSIFEENGDINLRVQCFEYLR